MLIYTVLTWRNVCIFNILHYYYLLIFFIASKYLHFQTMLSGSIVGLLQKKIHLIASLKAAILYLHSLLVTVFW